MIRRVCPVCDQVMAGRHYCKNCRKWIKRPIVMDITYYLNERRPKGMGFPVYREEKRKEQGAAPVRGRVQKEGGGWELLQEESGWEPQNVSSPKKKGRRNEAKKTSFPILIVLVLYVLIRLFGGLIGNFGSGLIDIVGDLVEEMSDSELEMELEITDNGYETLKDEDVIREGIPCNQLGHFQMSGPEMIKMLQNWMVQRGAKEVGREIYSYNDRSVTGDTWYVTCIHIDYSSDLGMQYFDVSYDTATEQMHSLTMSLQDSQRMVEMVEDVFEYLEIEMDDRGQVRKEMLPSLEQHEEGGIYWNEFYLEWYWYDDTVCEASLYCWKEPDRQ